MMNYGAIVCETKKMGPVNSSAEGEGTTSTSKCAELVMFPVQEAARAMGIALGGPTIIRSDNAANVRVANDPNAAVRLKHALRRYATLQGHAAAGEVKIVHVPDKFNAADFLTKWVSAKKLKESVAYTSNEVAKPKEPITTETNAFEVEMTAVTNLFGLEVSALELFEPETTHADPKYFAARLFTTDEVIYPPSNFSLDLLSRHVGAWSLRTLPDAQQLRLHPRLRRPPASWQAWRASQKGPPPIAATQDSACEPPALATCTPAARRGECAG